MTRDDIQIGRLYKSTYEGSGNQPIYASYIYPVSNEPNGLFGVDVLTCISIWEYKENSINNYTSFEINKHYRLVE